jgi:hypothetical protein
MATLCVWPHNYCSLLLLCLLLYNPMQHFATSHCNTTQCTVLLLLLPCDTMRLQSSLLLKLQLSEAALAIEVCVSKGLHCVCCDLSSIALVQCSLVLSMQSNKKPRRRSFSSRVQPDDLAVCSIAACIMISTALPTQDTCIHATSPKQVR